MAGTFYVVPTPVGNLSDMTPRAVEVLKSVDIILAEDTRTSAVLLRHYGISTPMQSYHKFNEHEITSAIGQRIAEGQDIALISDAGTPGISDPGFLLARECRELGAQVITLPGATAFVPALISSGLPCDRFTFQGFLPLKKGRQTRLEEIANSPISNIIYESPLRLVRTLGELAKSCGPEREASVSREISKKYEETRCGTLEDLQKHYTSQTPKGEIVIVVGPKPQIKTKVHRNKYKDTEDLTSSD